MNMWLYWAVLLLNVTGLTMNAITRRRLKQAEADYMEAIVSLDRIITGLRGEELEQD